MLATLTRDKKGRIRKAPRVLNLIDRDGELAEVIVDLREDSLQYTWHSDNRKTDDMPQQGVGATREESLQTCDGCTLKKSKTCYSQFGPPAIGFASSRKAVERGGDRSIENALKRRNKNAKYFRMGAVGDPGSVAEDVYLEHDAKARAEGLGVLSFTHQWHWIHASFLKGLALASCDTWRDVKDALKAGWRTTWHVDKNDEVFNGKSIVKAPQGTVDGKKYFLCPAQRKEYLGTGKEIHCNDCGLCDGKAKTNVDVIVFIEHGAQMNMKKRREAKLAAETITLEWE